MTRAFIGLGSNLGDREGHLEAALRELDRVPETELVRCSSAYETDPLGDTGQPCYLNAVAELATELEAGALLGQLRNIELRRGRPISGRAGPRALDLDLLFHGESVVERPGLQVPHPRFADRDFVLVPMVELDPGWRDPRTGLRMDQLLSPRRGPGSVRWHGRLR